MKKEGRKGRRAREFDRKEDNWPTAERDEEENEKATKSKHHDP